MSLFFPLLCLVLGLLTDALASTSVMRRVPSSVLQLLLACVTTILMVRLLDPLVVTQVLEDWTWVNMDPHTLMTVLLPVLIFESAFALEVHTFIANKWMIGCLASFCFVVAVFVQACMTGLLHHSFLEIDQRWSFITTLTFASIISATDPVAVVSLLGSLGAPTRLKVLVEGESLCNDGVAVLAVNILERAVLKDSGKIDVRWPLEISSRVGGLLLTFGIGIAAALMVASVMRHIHDGRVQQASVVIGVFGTWILSEHLKGSGVVGVVCFGLTLRYNRDSMRHHACEECESLWELLAMWANFIIFIISGMVIGQVIANFDPQGSEVILVLFVYICTLVSRGVALAPFFVIMWIKRPGDLPELKYWTVMTWGGLRGAVGLLLALHMNEVLEETGNHEHGQRILFYTAITVLCTLLIQATTAEPIVKKMQLNVKARRLEQDCKRLEKQLNKSKKSLMAQMSIDPQNFYLGGLSWAFVGNVTHFKFGNNETKNDASRKETPSMSPFISPETSGTSKEPSGAQVEEQELEEEARESFITMIQKRAWQQWKDGILSRNTISHIETALEEVRDKLYKVVTQSEEESTRGTTQLIITHLGALPSYVEFKTACFLESVIDMVYTRHAKKVYAGSRTEEWWQVLSTLMVVAQFYLARMLYFSPENREYVQFFLMLSCFVCVIEQLILFPSYLSKWTRHRTAHIDAPGWFYLLYTVVEFIYVLYYIMWAMLCFWSIAPYTGNSDNCIMRVPSEKVPNEFLVSWVPHGICIIILWFPLGVTFRFSIKFLLSVQFLADVLVHTYLERIRIKYMLHLASLYTVLHITDEICTKTLLESYSNKVVWRIWDLNGTLRMNLEEALVLSLDNVTMLYVSNLVKTRQACRTVTTKLMLASDELAKKGLMSDGSRELVEHRLEEIESNITRLTLMAPEANAREQMHLVSWINQKTDDMHLHGHPAPHLVDLMYSMIESPIDHNQTNPFVWLDAGYQFYGACDMQHSIYFISEGMVKVSDCNLGEPGTYIYPGNWIGQQALIEGGASRKRNAIAVAATPVLATRLGGRGIAKLVMEDPVVERRLILEEVVAKCKQLCQAMIPDMQMASEHDLMDFIKDELLTKLSADYVVKMPMPECVRLVLIHGQMQLPSSRQWLSVHVCDEDVLQLPKVDHIVRPLTAGDYAYILRLRFVKKCNGYFKFKKFGICKLTREGLIMLKSYTLLHANSSSHANSYVMN